MSVVPLQRAWQARNPAAVVLAVLITVAWPVVGACRWALEQVASRLPGVKRKPRTLAESMSMYPSLRAAVERKGKR